MEHACIIGYGKGGEIMNVKRQEHFNQVCVWPGCLIDGNIEGFTELMKEKLNTRVQYLEEIETGPDMKNGRPVKGTGGRNDLFFAVHDEDIVGFAFPRLSVSVRWIEDVLNNEEEGCSLYPERVKEYREW